MWIMTKHGFYSIVQKPNETGLQVRARSAADLDNLRREYAPNLGENIPTFDGDYPWRALISHDEMAQAMAKATLDVTYANFKNTLQNRRHSTYMRIWSTLHDIENEHDSGVGRGKWKRGGLVETGRNAVQVSTPSSKAEDVPACKSLETEGRWRGYQVLPSGAKLTKRQRKEAERRAAEQAERMSGYHEASMGGFCGECGEWVHENDIEDHDAWHEDEYLGRTYAYAEGSAKAAARAADARVAQAKRGRGRAS